MERFRNPSTGKIDRCDVAESIDVDAQHLHPWQAWGVFESQQGNHERPRELFQRGVECLDPARGDG